MTALASHKVQEAVFSILDADTTLGLKLTGVYDQPPETAAFPYLSMGDTNVSVTDLKDRSGVRLNFEVSLWSDEPSQMQVKELMADVDAVLHRNNVQVLGFDTLPMRLLNANIVRQYNEAGSLYRGRLSYSVLVYSQS